MFDHLLHSLSRVPGREDLVNATVDDDGDAVMNILMDGAAHEDLLADDFLTPYLMLVVEQELTSIWKVLGEFGYGESTVLVHPDDLDKDFPGLGREGTRLGSWAAMYLSPAQIESFAQMSPNWRPWDTGSAASHGTCSAVMGMLFGSAATFDYWFHLLHQDERVGGPSSHRQERLLRSLIKSQALLLNSPHTDALTAQTTRHRQARTLDMEFASMSKPGQPSDPHHGLAGQVLAWTDKMVHDRQGALVIQSLLEWAKRKEPSVIQAPIEQRLASEGQWIALAAALKAGWPVQRQGSIIEPLMLAAGKAKGQDDRQEWCHAWLTALASLEASSPADLAKYRDQPWLQAAVRKEQWFTFKTLLKSDWSVTPEAETSLTHLLLLQPSRAMSNPDWQGAWDAWSERMDPQILAGLPKVCRDADGDALSGAALAKLSKTEQEKMRLSLHLGEPAESRPAPAKVRL